MRKLTSCVQFQKVNNYKIYGWFDTYFKIPVQVAIELDSFPSKS